uniref:Uncharacterized protein n=1 Tax=Graphocephala atropunctata TaxID=36148 RepID=A0A1B6KRR9_9HEMI
MINYLCGCILTTSKMFIPCYILFGLVVLKFSMGQELNKLNLNVVDNNDTYVDPSDGGNNPTNKIHGNRVMKQCGYGRPCKTQKWIVKRSSWTKNKPTELSPNHSLPLL